MYQPAPIDKLRFYLSERLGNNPTLSFLTSSIDVTEKVVIGSRSIRLSKAKQVNDPKSAISEWAFSVDICGVLKKGSGADVLRDAIFETIRTTKLDDLPGNCLSFKLIGSSDQLTIQHGKPRIYTFASLRYGVVLSKTLDAFPLPTRATAENELEYGAVL